MSNLSYSLPFHTLNKSEEGQVDSIIRGAYKAALGLPIGTPTDRLLEFGVHNTVLITDIAFGPLSSLSGPESCDSDFGHRRISDAAVFMATMAEEPTPSSATPVERTRRSLVRTSSHKRP
ncbi:hypothetical protein HPB52_003977 [Rhipicephalus sanguineus]|uniref:Uncharacterized protein n=1 Tax=Rhipicephalus sanguineus TaxID=34632 RepID=A0A9D4STN6_RHISA|nr:hypothetical protein HPB52_003977 [Rhipicephalus sanguineus]